jgi:hypothetical protein
LRSSAFRCCFVPEQLSRWLNDSVQTSIQFISHLYIRICMHGNHHSRCRFVMDWWTPACELQQALARVALPCKVPLMFFMRRLHGVSLKMIIEAFNSSLSLPLRALFRPTASIQLRPQTHSSAPKPSTSDPSGPHLSRSSPDKTVENRPLTVSDRPGTSYQDAGSNSMLPFKCFILCCFVVCRSARNTVC